MGSPPDHFSARADGYSRYRPTYPADLISWLAGESPRRRVAWDCATGTGQVAVALADHFELVIASDASLALLATTPRDTPVRFLRSTAESPALGPGTVDLVTVAEALHWFVLDRFFAVLREVVAPDGLMAAWCYTVPSIDQRIAGTLTRLLESLDPYWPEGMSALWDHYRSIRFPFELLPAPSFAMTAEWTAEQMLGHLRTWSAVARAETATGVDPVDEIESELRSGWGLGTRRVRWPLSVYAGRF